MLISKRSLDNLVMEEVSSQAMYEKKYRGIVVPPGESGGTIGIGYDLGQVTPDDIQRHWKAELSQPMINILKMFSGLKGDKARRAIAVNMIAKEVNIPFQSAINVFSKISLPDYGRKALSIYPGLDKLTPDAVGALVSLIYNRGTDLTGDRRKEMKAIVPLVKEKDYDGIAAEIIAMKRLWGDDAKGLLLRREREAALVKGSNRQYTNDELIEI